MMSKNKLMVQQCIENIMNIQEAYMYIHVAVKHCVWLLSGIRPGTAVTDVA